MAMPLAVPRYSIADLDRWPPDGNRYELLSGVLLVTPAPGSIQQVGQLFSARWHQLEAERAARGATR